MIPPHSLGPTAVRDELRSPGTCARIWRHAVACLSARPAIFGRPEAALILLGAAWLFLHIFNGTAASSWQILRAPFAAFFYPLELEWREGSTWLHVLAQLNGIDIYDHSKVAYVNMNHGPINPLVTYWIARWLPDLSPWQVCRSFVLLLPFVLVIASAIVLRRSTRHPWLVGTIFGLATYVVLMSSEAGHFLLYGRTDATAHVLAVVALLLLLETIMARREGARKVVAVLAGFMMGASLFTLWRVLPMLSCAFAIAVVLIWLKTRNVRDTAYASLGCVAGGLLVLLLLMTGVFHGHAAPFFQHFFGFFVYRPLAVAPEPNWSERMQEMRLAFDALGTLGTHLWIILLMPLALLALCWLPARDDFAFLRAPRWIGGVVALYASAFGGLCAGFWLNFGAGSLVYVSFIYLLGWFLLVLVINSLQGWRAPAVAVAIGAGLVLLATGGRGTSVGAEHDRIAALTDSARALDYELSRLRQNYVVAADTNHFFKRRFDHDVADMGDAVSAAVRDGLFGDSFNHTYKTHIASLRSHPPDIVLTAIASAPPMRELVRDGYTCILCGTRFFAYGPSGFSLYARNDLPVDELKTRFASFAEPDTNPPPMRRTDR